MPAAPQAAPRLLHAPGGDRVSILTGEWSSGCRGRGGSGALAGPESHRSHTWPWLENSPGQPATGPCWGQGASPTSDPTAAFTGCPLSGTLSAPGSFHPRAQQQPRNHQAECPLGSLVWHLAQRGTWQHQCPRPAPHACVLPSDTARHLPSEPLKLSWECIAPPRGGLSLPSLPSLDGPAHIVCWKGGQGPQPVSGSLVNPERQPPIFQDL